MDIRCFMSDTKDTSPVHILIIEDDRDIRSLIVEFLSREGYVMEAVDGAVAADRALSRHVPDLIILDLMMPGEDGLSFCRRLRSRHAVPVLMLTAKDEDIDRIIGLEMGADDYMGKPFNPRELLARIRAILRRAQPVSKPTDGRNRKSFADITVDLDARSIETADGQQISLTTAEFDLLTCFLERPKRVLSRDQLLDWTRGRNADPFDRTIDVTVSRLRTKLSMCLPDDVKPITTVRNVGYLFNITVADA
jgi:two-component system OmpR family response regulator